jgi:hypothetical protein
MKTVCVKTCPTEDKPIADRTNKIDCYTNSGVADCGITAWYDK